MQPRQHQRDGQRRRQDFADQQAIGVDRGGKSDALRHPEADERRQRRLHHRDAERHHHGAEIEHRDARANAAQAGACRAQEDADQQCVPRTKPGDHQRAGDGCAGKQHHRQARENADLRLRQMQVVMDQRYDRRHREDREPQRHAREPQQRQRAS